MMLLEKHRKMLGGDILPVPRVDIPALCSPGMLAPFPLLELFDLSGGVLANAWFISVGTDDDELPFLLLGPGVWETASPTLALDEAARGRSTALGGFIATGVARDAGLFGHAWEG